MRFDLFFDLLAELIKRISALDTPAIISDDSKEQMQNQVDSFFRLQFKEEKFFSYDTLPLTSQIVFDIIKWAEEFNNYWLYKALLERLDGMINIDRLVNSLDINNISSNDPLCFFALNSNEQQTGIVIFPKVFSPKAEHERKQDDEVIRLGRPTAKVWYNPINAFLKKCFFVTFEEFKGYKVRNIMISAPDDAIKEGYITIGVTPVCNIPMKEILSFNKDIQRTDNLGNVSKFFGDVSVKDPNEINERYRTAYKLACENNVHILLGPEMLGTVELNQAIEGINPLYNVSSPTLMSPLLVIPPTFWRDGKNMLNAFSQHGEFVGTQFKQHPYVYEGEYTEDLIDTPKEILLIHIHGFGRIAFLICMDYLYTDFRDLLTRTLQADFLLCPSYSSGTSPFDTALTEPLEFGVRCVWLNSCSAVTATKEKADYVGIVSTPIISKDSPKQYLIPTCKGQCRKGCLFTLKIPLNCANNEPGRKHEDNKVIIEHLLE